MKLYCIFTVLVLFSGAVKADYAVNLIQYPGPTDNGLNLLSTGDSNLGIMGNGSTAHWNIAQWHNPTPFTTNAVAYGQGGCSTPNSYWSKAGTNARVCVAPYANRNNYVEIASNGYTNLQCGVEFNMFLQTNKKPAIPNSNINMTGGFTSYSSMTFGFAVQIKYASVTARCGTHPQCSSSPDYGYLTASFTLSNPNGQTLFYQIILWDSRYADGCGWGNPCVSTHSWFAKTNPFGVSDSIAAYGKSCLTGVGSGRVVYSVDILPKIVSAITTGAPAGMDTNPANWNINEMYIGTGVQGETAVTFAVDSITLVAQHKSAGTTGTTGKVTTGTTGTTGHVTTGTTGRIGTTGATGKVQGTRITTGSSVSDSNRLTGIYQVVFAILVALVLLH